MAWHFDLATDIGGRAEQQDRAQILSVPYRPDEYLVVLADGMGGQQEGALAAQTVIDTAKREFVGAAIASPKDFLIGLCEKADDAIRQIGRQLRINPASTCTALLVRDDEAYWAHVGDSRLYQFNAGHLVSRTPDHTVAELLRANREPRIADRFPRPKDNRLYMCLGGQNSLEPEYGATAIGSNDWFLLCSDGFWNQVGAEEVADRLMSAAAEEKIAPELATLAAQRGGPDADNVSLVLATQTAPRVRGAWHRLLTTGMRFGR